MDLNKSFGKKIFPFLWVAIPFILSFFSLNFNCYAASIIMLTYPQSCVFGYICGPIDYDLPGTPSLDREAYVDTLNYWALTAEHPIQISKADIELYIDQPTYKKPVLSSVSFDVVNEGEIEKFDFGGLENYSIKAQMRDIVFLESMQKSILKWETDYISSLSSGDKFADIFDRAIRIFEQYQLYTGKKGFLDVRTNPVLNTLLGAGNTSYGNLFAADGTVEGFTEDLFVELSAKIYLEDDLAAGLSSVKVELKDPTTWLDLGKQFARDLVLDQLVENKVIGSFSSQSIKNMFDVSNAIQKGGIGLIMAPAKLYYSTFSELMTIYNDASGGAYFTFYYFLMDKYPEKSSSFFYAGALKTWPTMSAAGQQSSICNEYNTSELDTNDTVATILCQTANYTNSLNFGWLDTTDGQAEYATSLANLFLFIKNINIRELKTKVAQQVALEKESDNPTPAPDTTITHNGVTYGTVTSPHTGKVWLDRNLGASRVCTAYNDTACYGDYYQWGRNTDGHEKSNSTVTSIQATDINNAGVSFITADGTQYYWDWAKNIDNNGSLREANWNRIDGSSVCPTGYRVPTIGELIKETIDVGLQNHTDVFNSFLKLPVAGFRHSEDASLWHQGEAKGEYWSTTVSSNGANTEYLYISNDMLLAGGNVRAHGNSVRCIKETTRPTANAGLDQTVAQGATVTLDASASSDSDGTIVSYQWKEVNIVLSNSVSFTASNLSIGTHIITLTVTDDDGAENTDTVMVTINTTDSNPPTISISNTSWTSPTILSADMSTADDKNITRTSFAIYDSRKYKLDIRSSVSVTSPASTFNSDPTALTWGYVPNSLSTTTSWKIDISGLSDGSYYIKFFVTDGINPVVETEYLSFTKVIPTNGACGTSQGGSFISIPTTNLCSAGAASSVTGTTIWQWSCQGTGGGTNASCSAKIQSYTVSGNAGNGGSISPTTQSVNHGATTNLSVIADSDYFTSGVSGCNGTLSGNTYTTGAISANCTVTVNRH